MLAVPTMQVIRFLESLTTEVGPRLAGSPADARAVAWAEAKFKELGFRQSMERTSELSGRQRGIEKPKSLRHFRNHC